MPRLDELTNRLGACAALRIRNASSDPEDPNKTAVAYRHDPDIHSGAAVFEGTRVAVWVLFNWVAAGKTLDEFLAAHPQVDPKSAVEALDDASRALVGQDSHGE